jgi:small subunit ribosomal protein S2
MATKIKIKMNTDVVTTDTATKETEEKKETEKKAEARIHSVRESDSLAVRVDDSHKSQLVLTSKKLTSVSNVAKKTKKVVERVKEKKKKVKKAKSNIVLGLEIDEMTENGLHLGHKTANLNPKMSEYIVGIRNGIHIINLEKTAICLEKALKFISELVKENKIMLMVGTKPPFKKLIYEAATESNFPYIVERWIGGIFTNFKVVSERAKYYKDLREQKEKGELEKFIKKERIRKEKQLVKMGKKFEGIKNLEKIPEAIFICDINKDKLALKEAKMKGVKVVAICDTNVNPVSVDFPIPASDDSILSIKYILNKIKETIRQAS